jgi:phosphoglycerol transferase MdoB-like AlkP superfamily enzyme
MLTSDDALVDQMIKRADKAEKPLFMFAVTLQNHGPYEPGRYKDARSRRVARWTTGRAARSRRLPKAWPIPTSSLQKLIDWAQKRERPTVIAYFGDHLPPMGPAYVGTGFLPDNVAPRAGPGGRDEARARDAAWSCGRTARVRRRRSALLARFTCPTWSLRQAGIQHPYYTGILGRLHAAYPVVDRQLLIAKDGSETRDWSRAEAIDPLIEKQRLMQYDILFGDRLWRTALFPQAHSDGAADCSACDGFPALISPRNPV